ncbi:MAG: cation transporter [Kineosporiaceae bacterium]
MTTTATYTVKGMTCGHCVNAVTEELSALDGVTGVQVDLVAGGLSPVTVTSEAPLDADAVAAAVDEAGYALAEEGEAGAVPAPEARRSLPLSAPGDDR